MPTAAYLPCQNAGVVVVLVATTDRSYLVVGIGAIVGSVDSGLDARSDE